MARAIEVPVVAKKGTLARSIEGEAATAFRNLGRSSGAVAPLGRMLGKIRADADEFTKSIEASNARVIAFGASVGVINGISNAFKELVRVTVSVEKSLTDINVVLNANQSQLTKFGDGLFKVAKNTAQSFDVVAEAATEFARQGLSIEETLRRTNDALVLTRLTGIKAADAVKGLTAATNGFAKAGLTTTEIINKLAAVDVKFAVSADGLVEALKRTGAVAMDAGLSFDELIGMVTAAQQTTARGEAVIGNAFKTIFTRVQRPETLRTLRELKIAVEDASGAALPATQVLQNLANSYDGLSRSAKDAITQQVAGVFQINILKAAVSDLQKQNSIAARATAVSASATDEAAKKNEMLNQTIAALTTQTGLALTELAKKIGDIALAPGMRDLVGSFKALVEGTTGVLDGEGTGSTFARGLLKGIGNVLTGPGLIVIGGVFIKLFKDLTVFGMNSLKNLLGLNNAAKQQAALQQGIGTLLQTNTAYQTQMAAAAGNVNKQAAITQRFLQQEIAMRQQAAALTSGMAGAAFMGGFRVDKAGDLTKKRRGLRGMVPGLAPTEVPNFMLLGGAVNFLKRNNGQKASGVINNLEGAGREAVIMRSLGLHGGLGSSISSLSTKGKGRIEAGPDISEEMMRKSGVLAGDVKPGLIKSKGSSDIFGSKGRDKKTGIEKYGIGQYTRASAQGGITYSGHEQFSPQQLEAARKSSSGAFTYAFPGGKAGQVARGENPFAGGYGDPNSPFMGPATPKQIQRFHDMEAASARVRASGLPDRGEFRAMPVNFSDSTMRRFFYKSVGLSMKPPVRPKFTRRGNDFDGSDEEMTAILDYLKGKDFAFMQPHMTKAANLERRAARFRGATPTFAPIGDAIQREKLQVGGLLGINPSQVKTKVIQNTALRSSFNPGGFGVISPTIGQNSFADARRMHKGEDLRTANLPNFMTPLPVSGIDPLGGRKPLSMTPVGYTETIKTIITGVEDEPAKKLGTSTAKALARPTPVSTGLRADDMLVKTKEVAAAKELEKQAKIPGGRLSGLGMGAFMAYSVGTMGTGFAPQVESMLGLGRGRGEGAITGAALGAFGGAKAGGALGAMIGGPVGGAIGFVGGGLAGLLGGGSLGAAGIDNIRRSGSMLLHEGKLVNPISIAKKRDNQLELFESQRHAAMTASLDRFRDREADISRFGFEDQLALAARQNLLTRRSKSGLETSQSAQLRLAQAQSTLNRQTIEVDAFKKRESFVVSQGKQIVDALGKIPIQGGGASESQFRNVVRAMAEQGDFEGIANMFNMIRSTPIMQDERFVESGTDIDPVTREMTPYRNRLVKAPFELAMDQFGGDITDEQKNQGIPQRALDAMKNRGVDTISYGDFARGIQSVLRDGTEFSELAKESAKGMEDLEEAIDFTQKMGDLSDSMREMNVQMQNVDKITNTFSSSLGNAFSNISTGASSVGDAFRNMAMSVLTEINRMNTQFLASELTGALLGGNRTQGFLKHLVPTGPKGKRRGVSIDVMAQQKGGLIKAQNGMYISGGRTGDKNPAMLEDGEYVLNRNAVKALGGPSAIDGLNFGIAPRFQSGGRLASPVAGAGVRSSSLNKIIEENEFLPPMAGMGTALGGGGSSVRLGITDPRLSGFAHANDPVLQNVRADVQKYHERRRQKQFEKQGKLDQLVKTVVGVVVGAGVAKGVNFAKGAFSDFKMNRQALADESEVFGEGFDFGPLQTAPATGPKGFGGVPREFTQFYDKLNPLGPVPHSGPMSAGIAKNFGFAGPIHPPGKMGQLADLMDFQKMKLRDAMLSLGIDTSGDRGTTNKQTPGKGVFGMGLRIRNQLEDMYKRGGQKVPTGETMKAAQRLYGTRALRELDIFDTSGRFVRKEKGVKLAPSTGEPVRPFPQRFPRAPGKQSGGYIDNIPAMLTGGEFVVNPSTVRRHGSAFFSKLNRGGRIGYQTGGIVGDQQFVPAQGDTQNNNKTETSNNNATSNTTVNITVNTGTGETNVDGGNAGTEDREMATRLRDAVLSVLKQEKRTGGMLRDVTSNDQ